MDLKIQTEKQKKKKDFYWGWGKRTEIWLHCEQNLSGFDGTESAERVGADILHAE